MAFRRNFRRFTGARRGRGFRRNPYDVQRFHLCNLLSQVGPGTCSDGGTTNALVLIAPDPQVAAANGAVINAARLAGVDKALTLGGMRFWTNWSTSSDGLSADFNDIIFTVRMMLWIAKVPVDPELRTPAYLPDPFAAAIQSDIQYDFLWTQLWVFALAKSSNAASPRWILTSSGSEAQLAPTFGISRLNYSPPPLPVRVKTKRRLLETDVLMFGVSGFHNVGVAADVPIVTDMHGQVAVKRSLR